MTDVMGELWKPVIGYEGLYEVSNKGRVRSTRRQGTDGRMVAQYLDQKGYPTVRLWKGNQESRARVHLLVLPAFVGPKPEGYQCRHLDDEKTNNRLSNLQWGTASENTLDKVQNGRHPMANRTACPHGHPYDEANTYINKRNQRHCRACARDRYHRRKAAA